MTALRVIVVVASAAVMVRTLASAVRTFVIPRDEPTALMRAVFAVLHVPFFAVARRRDRPHGHRIMRAFAPSALLVLPIVWMFTAWLCFAGFYWGIGEGGWSRALEISGSSITSLGIHAPNKLSASIIAFGEAALGLGLVALLITYLPTIYAAYQRREGQVSLLSVRAGTPPSAVEMLVRFQRINLLSETAHMWTGWEQWFVDMEESHTSMGMLAYFQSGLPNHSWVTASGAVLDSASLLLSSVAIEEEPRAALCIRSGYLALRHIADFFDIAYEDDPDPSDPISVSRAEFDDALQRLENEGIPLKTDRDRAWREFCGWRVNYDGVLLSLCTLVWAPDAPWSGDRAGDRVRLPLTRRGGRGQGTRRAHERTI